MNIDTDKLAKEIIDNFKLIDQNDIPNIALYMDQVTSFMDEHLLYSKRYDDDKILTKTMINNYAKNNLLPPPEKKRYSKEHIIMLTFIYYFKNVMSISDIKTVLTGISDKYFSNESDIKLVNLYEEISQLQQKDIKCVNHDIAAKTKLALGSFQDSEGSDKDFLQLFSLLSLLSFDVYAKKQLIESIVDVMNKHMESESDSSKQKEKPKDKKNQK